MRRSQSPKYRVSRISTKNRLTIPEAALAGAGLRPGDRVLVEALGDGELLIRRAPEFDDAFGAMTGMYPQRYLEQIDNED